MVKPSGIMHRLWEAGRGFEGEGKKMIHVTTGKYSKRKEKNNHVKRTLFPFLTGLLDP